MMVFRYPRLVIGLVIVGVALLHHNHAVRQAQKQGYERGVTETLEAVRQASERARRRADDAAEILSDCPLGQWNREAGKCER